MSAAESTGVVPGPHRERLAVLQGVFVVSGVCGLIYESIWSHYLKLFVGHAAYAQTVVLIVFIGGMALGAWLTGRFTHRISAPLVAYAVVELVVGVVSLLFHRLFVGATDWAYAVLLPIACVPESPCIAQWLFAAALILPQSILLGTTFPLMTGGVLRLAPAGPGRKIALFYFLNSIGAAVGVLLAGFVLIPALGLPGTLLTAGLMNVAVALVAYACTKGAEVAAPLQAAPASVPANDVAGRRAMIVVAALTGLSSFIYEIIWIRMLSVVVGASTHAFELMLAAFILGLALGGLWVRKRIDRFRDLIGTLAVVQVLMGIAAVATLGLYDGMFDFLSWLIGALKRSESAYAIYNVANHGLALVIMLPATFLAGMTFPLITTALLKGRDGERAIGYVYAANTVGSIVGVILAVHFALPVLGVKGGLLFGASIDIALGIALLAGIGAAQPADRGRLMRWAAAGATTMLAVALFVPVLPERMAAGVYRYGVARLSPSSEILFNRDGKTASITVMKSPVATSIITNGKPDASVAHDATKPVSDEVTMALTAMLPLAYRPHARTAAVIGFGSGMTTTTLLGSPALERVDTIEIEPEMVRGARLFGTIVEPAYADPRSRIVIDDAKSYFARSDLRYDLILSEPSNPWVSGVASLFTREFYTRVKRQLGERGLFLQWLQIYEFNDRLLVTILRALDAEFDDYVVYSANEGDLVVIASASGPVGEPSGDVVAWPGMQRMAQRLRLTSLDELEARRIAGRPSIRPLLSASGGATNSDYFPLVEQEAPKARFAGQAAELLIRAASAPVPVVEMFNGLPPPALDVADAPVAAGARRQMIQTANATAQFLATGAQSSTAPLPRDTGLLRAILWECASTPPRVSIAELMADVAVYVNPMLPADRAAAVWNSVRGARCASRLTAADVRWLDLFHAIGDRDAARMFALGAPLVDDPGAGESMRWQAFLAAVAGASFRGEFAAAQRLIDTRLSRFSPAARGDPALLLLAGVLASRRDMEARGVRPPSSAGHTPVPVAHSVR
jgi:spermidine synthase